MSVAAHCRCEGDGIVAAIVRQQSAFKIVALSEAGESLDDINPEVHVRGSGVLVRSRITDNQDGTFTVVYTVHRLRL